MMELTGTVEEIIFRNEETGFTVFMLGMENDFQTVTGTFPLLREGEFITLSGLLTEHPTYGEQFKAERYEIVQPRTAAEIEQYLSSGIVKGIGPKTARDIVDTFGDQALEIIEHQPNRLLDVPGIGRKKAALIVLEYKETAGAQKTVMFLQRYGVTAALAMKVYNRYGADTVDLLQQNPYRMVADIEGVGFLTADKIASSMGMDRTSHYRISAGVRYLLQEAGSEGHTFLPEDELCRRAKELLGIPEDKLKEELLAMGQEQAVVLRDAGGLRAVYHPAFFMAEAMTAGRLLQLRDTLVDEQDAAMDREITAYEKEKQITLAALQREAVKSALTNGLCVITGGPGTGKTTTLDCLIHLLRKRGVVLALAAPTGRAAKRMSLATGEDAKTIHRMLEYTKMESGFRFKRDHDNPVEADVCIVDEASMIDIFLMQALLEGLKKGARLILVGDRDQLPSVGAGNVLADVIASGVFPVVQLTEIFRQAQESMIVVNAHRINHGRQPLVNGAGSDFFLVSRTNEGAIADGTVDLCLRRLPQKYGLSPIRDIQVLTPIKKGLCGVFNLNKRLQEALNPPEKGKREHRFGEELLLREGDKLMQIRNNYDREWVQYDAVGLATEGTGVFNGDCAILHKIDENAHELTLIFEDERVCTYAFADVEELTLAYAISVHKSQGCEFPFVVMPLPPVRVRIMTRNLFYTAVTRAQKMVVLCGSDSSVRGMVENTETQKRYSALDLRLQTGKQLL